MNITIGTKLQAVKSGIIATVSDINDKYKTAFVELSDGGNARYSLATLKDKRRWVIVTNDEVKEITQKQESEALEQVSEIKEKAKMTPMPGTEDLNCGQKHFCEGMIDEVVFAKFVKKAQKLITQAIHDKNGYHVTINVNGKEIFYHDKNLQNIRSAIGHIYRGEVTV